MILALVSCLQLRKCGLALNVNAFLTGTLINGQIANTADAVIRAMTVAVHVGTRNCDNIKTIDIMDFRSSRVGELEAREMRNVSSSGGRWLAILTYTMRRPASIGSTPVERWFPTSMRT